jgi:hypothetical protein
MLTKIFKLFNKDTNNNTTKNDATASVDVTASANIPETIQDIITVQDLITVASDATQRDDIIANVSSDAQQASDTLEAAPNIPETIQDLIIVQDLITVAIDTTQADAIIEKELKDFCANYVLKDYDNIPETIDDIAIDTTQMNATVTIEDINSKTDAIIAKLLADSMRAKLLTDSKLAIDDLAHLSSVERDLINHNTYDAWTDSHHFSNKDTLNLDAIQNQAANINQLALGYYGNPTITLPSTPDSIALDSTGEQIDGAVDFMGQI